MKSLVYGKIRDKHPAHHPRYDSEGETREGFDREAYVEEHMSSEQENHESEKDRIENLPQYSRSPLQPPVIVSQIVNVTDTCAGTPSVVR